MSETDTLDRLLSAARSGRHGEARDLLETLDRGPARDLGRRIIAVCQGERSAEASADAYRCERDQYHRRWALLRAVVHGYRVPGISEADHAEAAAL